MKIYLVGMPGSGKSTLGIRLAHALSVDFVDLDKEIENREQKKVSDIFRDNGEDYFRLKEAEALREFAGANRSFILATGGGAPCFYNGMETLNETGITVFLDVEINELIKRLEKKTDRPLLNNQDLEQRLSEILLNRLPVYNKASIILKNPSFESLLEKFKK